MVETRERCECGEQCVWVMAALSGCHQSGTHPTAIIPSPPPLSPNRPKLLLDLEVVSGYHPLSGQPKVKVGERELGTLRELEELLDSFCLQHKPNENESAPSQAFQHRVKPVPQLKVSISTKLLSIPGPGPDVGLLPDILNLFLKFKTKFRLIFSTPDLFLWLLYHALRHEILPLAKLVVAVEPHGWSNNHCLCSTTVVAKVIKCTSMVELWTFLLEIRHNSLEDVGLRYDDIAPYTELLVKNLGGSDKMLRDSWGFLRTEKTLGDSVKWFSEIFRRTHELQKLPAVWNLSAEVGGLQAPHAWMKKHYSTPQTLKLQVTLQPVVTGACSIAIGVRNVQVRVQNAYLDSSPSNLLGLFVSHITLSIRPEVEEEQVAFMLLGLPSRNEPFDFSAMRTIGVSASVTGSKNPGVAITATESSSTTIKLTTLDWCPEQTREDDFTGNFSWTLQSLAGVPFDYQHPECTKFSMFKRKPATSMLEFPFNSDGSLTFTEEQFPKKIEWTLVPELAGTDVAWFVSASVHLTTLNKSTGKGETLELRFPNHLRHKMITDVECTHT